MERTVRQRDKEISDLQKSLSDLQIFLLQEREQSVRLLAENDKLRIRELEDRKTMQHLLNIAGPNVAECSYFHKGKERKLFWVDIFINIDLLYESHSGDKFSQ